MTQPLTNEQKAKALNAVAIDAQDTIEHLTILVREQSEKKGRYESSGGVPLPEYLTEKYREKLADLVLGHQLIINAIAKLGTP